MDTDETELKTQASEDVREVHPLSLDAVAHTRMQDEGGLTPGITREFHETKIGIATSDDLPDDRR